MVALALLLRCHLTVVYLVRLGSQVITCHLLPVIRFPAPNLHLPTQTLRTPQHLISQGTTVHLSMQVPYISHLAQIQVRVPLILYMATAAPVHLHSLLLLRLILLVLVVADLRLKYPLLSVHLV